MTRRRLTSRKKALFAGAVLLALFLMAEAFVRATKPHVDLWSYTGRRLGPDPKASWADVDAFCAYRARPGHYTGYGSTASGLKTVNSDGYISTPEVVLEKPPGRIRIAFLGESSCAGTGSHPALSDEETWPWQVADRLRAAVPSAEIDFLNAAGSGFTTFESMGRLWARVRFYRPDAIVVYHGWNDIGLMHPETAKDGFHRWRIQDDGNWSLERRFTLFEPMAMDHLIRHSQLLSKLRLRLSQRHPELEDFRPMAPGLDLRSLEVSRDNLRLILATTKAIGAEAFVCKQATLMVPGLSLADRERCEHFSFPYDAHLEGYQAYWKMIDQEVPTSRVVDVTSINGRADLFSDHVHPNQAGAREVARLVADALLPWLRERAGSK